MITNLLLLQEASNASGATGQSGMINIIMIVALIAIFYFFMIRPQQKKQKAINKFREGLSVGDSVITAGGIYGKIRGIKDTKIIIEVADNVKITVDKGSVYPSAADAQEQKEESK